MVQLKDRINIYRVEFELSFLVTHRLRLKNLYNKNTSRVYIYRNLGRF